MLHRKREGKGVKEKDRDIERKKGSKIERLIERKRESDSHKRKNKKIRERKRERKKERKLNKVKQEDRSRERKKVFLCCTAAFSIFWTRPASSQFIE